MKIRRVLLVVKETAYQKMAGDHGTGSRHMKRLVAADDPSVSGIRSGHEEHVGSVAQVREALERAEIEVVERTVIPKKPIRGMDLVVTVGGDGMVLGVSHAVRDETPILGVNSAPSTSVGYLTGSSGLGFGRALDALAKNEIEPLVVHRLRVKLGRRVLAEPVLNDVLFCHDNPAVMTRYRLTWSGGEELQRSSGIWIGTPAGSTAALASAGGPILPLTGRQLAFLVREPYAPPGRAVRFRSAVLAGDESLSIECRVVDASVFIDGSHSRYPVGLGETVSFSLHPQPLRLVRDGALSSVP